MYLIGSAAVLFLVTGFALTWTTVPGSNANSTVGWRPRQGPVALTEQDAGQIEFDFKSRLMPEFGAAASREYFKLWLADGSLIRRSPSFELSRKLGKDESDAQRHQPDQDGSRDPPGGGAPPGDAQAGRGSSFSAIMSAIQSRNANAIISELERAERLICSRCIAPVRALLDNDDYRIRKGAAWWLTRRPFVMKIVAKEAEARLRGTDPRLARTAADMLGTFHHRDAIPVLTQTLGRQDFPSNVRAAALKALGRIGASPAESAVLMGLSDSGADARAAAIEAYRQRRGARDGAPLAAMVRDSDATVRLLASAAAGRYRLEGARAGLERVLLTDSDPMVRPNAAWARGRIGNPASRTALTEAASRDTHSFVRSAANLSLRRVRTRGAYQRALSPSPVAAASPASTGPRAGPSTLATATSPTSGPTRSRGSASCAPSRTRSSSGA